MYPVRNQTPRQAGETICVQETLVSLSLLSYGYFLVEKYIAAFAMFLGRYQESLIALQMSLGEVPLQHDPFGT